MEEREVEYSTVGNHITVDFWGVDFDKTNNLKYLEGLLICAAEDAGATVLDVVSRQFEPNGCTVLILLSESHASFHTYPQKGYISFDCYTCGETVDPYRAFKFVKSVIKPSRVHIKQLKRGLGEDSPIQIINIVGEWNGNSKV
jgi:S-adenosylmethionine decarboxylase